MVSTCKNYPISFFVNADITGMELAESTNDIINDLLAKVSAPTYKKTPTFTKRTNRRRLTTNKINDGDWEQIRNFKTTVICDEEKQNTISDIFSSIRESLNKLSNDTYETEKITILKHINNIINESTDLTSDMNRIGNAIFDIASRFTFYSKIYSDLYKVLYEQIDVFKSILNETVNSHKEIYNNIEYVDPDVDYNKFCSINEDNEKRRALSLFFANLLNNDVLSIDIILDIISSIQNRIDDLKNTSDNTEIIYELTKNLHIILTNNHIKLWKYNDSTNWDSIYSKIEQISEYDNNSFASINNKIIFEYLDMVDEFS